MTDRPSMERAEATQHLSLGEGASLTLTPSWLTADEAARCFEALRHEVPWEARAIRIFGREVMQPRLVSWHGDPEAFYTYSGVLHEPRPWTATLARLRQCLEGELALPLNSVLCNLYRDGRDSMGWHSDAEPELGENPAVVSVSLGATRKFSLRHRKGASHGSLDLQLSSGSLLVMRGTTQHLYRHAVPKQRTPCEARINLTFRHVRPR